MRGIFPVCCASANEESEKSRAPKKDRRIYPKESIQTRSIVFLTPFASRLVPHRITLSALASTFGGIVRLICFAVFRLMTTRISSAAPRANQRVLLPLESYPHTRRRAGTRKDGHMRKSSAHLPRHTARCHTSLEVDSLPLALRSVCNEGRKTRRPIP